MPLSRYASDISKATRSAFHSGLSALSLILLPWLAPPLLANALFNEEYCTTSHCRTVSTPDGTVIWITITLDDNYIDVPIDADSNSVR
jgi:hypothetical protein